MDRPGAGMKIVAVKRCRTCRHYINTRALLRNASKMRHYIRWRCKESGRLVRPGDSCERWEGIGDAS